MSKGFCNWKDATASFKKHKESKTHCEAVEAVITLPSTTKDVGELLSAAHKREKQLARDNLKIIISSICYLARQGFFSCILHNNYVDYTLVCNTFINKNVLIELST